MNNPSVRRKPCWIHELVLRSVFFFLNSLQSKYDYDRDKRGCKSRLELSALFHSRFWDRTVWWHIRKLTRKYVFHQENCKHNCLGWRMHAHDPPPPPPIYGFELWAVIWLHFTISYFALLPSPVMLSWFLPFLFLLAHSPDFFFPEKSFFGGCFFFFFGEEIVFFYLGAVNWLVVCAACCHMALVFAVMHLYNILIFFIASIFQNLVLINRRSGPRYQRLVVVFCVFFS